MRYFRLFPVITLTIGIMLLFYAIIPHGIGLSEDSISYLSAAQSLHRSAEMRDIDGSWFVAWAPLYPLVIAVLELFPFKVENALAALNLMFFSLTVISSWRLIAKALLTPFFRAACLLSIAFSFTIMQVYATALSESLFLLMINLILLSGTRGTWGTKDYVALGVLCGVAISLRYAGVFLVPVVLLLCWKQNEKISVGKLLIFLAIAVAPLAIWLTRNVLVTESYTGFRAPGSGLFLKNMTVLLETMTSWILPIKTPLFIRALALVMLMTLLWKNFVVKKLRLHFLLIVVYLLMLTTAYSLFSFEEPRDRLLAPVFISFFILLFASLENLTNRFPVLPHPFLAGFVCLWMAYPAMRIVKHAQLWHKEGVDIYNLPDWDNSPTLAWMNQNSLPGKTFSNDAYAIYYFTGKNAYRIPKYIYRFDQFHHMVKHGDHIVWWKNKEYHDLNLFKADYSLKEERHFNDAVIFSVQEYIETSN